MAEVKQIEIRVRPAVRYVLTEFESLDDGNARCWQVGEFASYDNAHELAYALAGWRGYDADGTPFAGVDTGQVADGSSERMVLDALNMLGSALADHGHQWTGRERRAYEAAVAIMRGRETES